VSIQLVNSKEENSAMSQNTVKTIERLEELAAWHRINAEHAGSAWVWEARLRTAEDLERQAAAIRARLASGFPSVASTVLKFNPNPG
jgi:hypothetical protein